MEKELSILFAGDFAPCRNFESIVLNKKEQVLGEALPLIESVDLSFVNLECPLTTYTEAICKSGPALKANPSCAEALKLFSVVGLANNHILDFGKQGLIDTLRACKSFNLSTVGAGEDLSKAQKPYIKEIGGTRVAVIAIAEYEFNQSENGGPGSAPIDPIDNYRQIKEAQEQADIVIVTLHGGNEYFPYPRPGLRKLCQHYIDLGVEAVICHHPHVPGAYEYYKGSPIVYSLGNFIFDLAKAPKDWETGYMALLNISTESKKFKSMELIPYKQSVKLGGIELLKGAKKVEFLQRIDGYKEKLDNGRDWLKVWDEYILSKSNSYILRQYFPFTFSGLGFLARKTPILRLLFNRSNRLTKLNMLRCQSHYETLISVVKSKSNTHKR